MSSAAYPLAFRFKLIALAPQIYVQDSAGRALCYVRQKMFRLREAIDVFADDSRSRQIASIAADRIIDWSAKYVFRDEAGRVLGAVGRRGLRSLWKAHYEVNLPETQAVDFTISEANPFAKLMDGIFGGIPVIGMFSGYLFHPQYVAVRADGTPAMRLTKQPAFWEGRYALEKLAEINPREEQALIYAFLMMILLERERG